jgi:hypothetical protein
MYESLPSELNNTNCFCPQNSTLCFLRIEEGFKLL